MLDSKVCLYRSFRQQLDDRPLSTEEEARLKAARGPATVLKYQSKCLCHGCGKACRKDACVSVRADERGTPSFICSPSSGRAGKKYEIKCVDVPCMDATCMDATCVDAPATPPWSLP